MKMNSTKCLEIKRFLLLILTLWFMRTGFGIQILYPQETSKTSSGTYSSVVLSSLATSFTTSKQYTMSAWVNLAGTSSTMTLFKLSQNYGTCCGYSERILFAGFNSSNPYIYSTGLSTVQIDNWNPWEGLTSVEMFPTGQWIFLALATDSTKNTQYGFRYYPEETVFFNTRTLSGASYSVTPSCTAFWGGDTFTPSAGETLQYVRIYLDYVPSSQDQMINLAIMLPGGTLYYFLLTTDYGAVQNLTIPIQYYQNLTQGSLTTSTSPTYPTTFGPYNMIMCEPGAILSYTPSATFLLSPRNLFAFDIQINSATNSQNLFSIRDSGSNYVSLTTYYDPADSLIKVQLQNPTWNIACTSSTPISLGSWNKVVVELERSNPNNFGFGFYSGRIFVNQDIPSRTYFEEIGVTPLLEDTTDMTIDICTTMVSGSSTLNSSFGGNYNMMNFVWYSGDESLFQNYSGYYLSGRVCVSGCSANEFLHSGSRSCQSCYYPSRYYTTTGYCIPCTLPSQSISGYSCILCDNTCATCYGIYSNQCTSCYSGYYLLSISSSGGYSVSSDSSCVECNINGYYISGSQCKQCDNACETCNGSLATNCLTCPSGFYLLSTNHSCVACNVNGYYISGSQCKQCYTTCQTCSGSLATNCLTCSSGNYFVSTNNSCVTCNASGYYISGLNCLQCDNTCQTCSGSLATNCLTCPSEAYFVSANDSCVACDTTCQTCNGSLATNCLTCSSEAYFVSTNNSCVSCNVSGYYISSLECLQCYNTCQTCNGSLATNCLTCPSGIYLDSANGSCLACDTICQTCNGSLATDCLTCPLGAYLVSANHSCVACDTTCQTCNGSLATNCLTCPSGNYFVSTNNSCVSCNVSGYYISGLECLQCNNTCQTCNGSLATNCLTCPSGTYFVSANDSCVACNVSGYYISGSQCKQCYTTCQTCSGSLATNCLTCSSGNYFVSKNNSCVSCNLNGYYTSESLCLECDSTCLTCNGTAPNTAFL